MELVDVATGTLRGKDKNNVRIFERQILRKIFGHVNNGNTSIWRIQNNVEIDKLTDDADIVIFIKAQRIKCLGHIQGGSNMTGTDLCVNKPHCAATVRP